MFVLSRSLFREPRALHGAQFGDWCPLELEMKFRRRTNGGEHGVATRYAGKARETYRVHGATIDFARTDLCLYGFANTANTRGAKTRGKKDVLRTRAASYYYRHHIYLSLRFKIIDNAYINSIRDNGCAQQRRLFCICRKIRESDCF